MSTLPNWRPKAHDNFKSSLTYKIVLLTDNRQKKTQYTHRLSVISPDRKFHSSRCPQTFNFTSTSGLHGLGLQSTRLWTGWRPQAEFAALLSPQKKYKIREMRKCFVPVCCFPLV